MVLHLSIGVRLVVKPTLKKESFKMTPNSMVALTIAMTSINRPASIQKKNVCVYRVSIFCFVTGRLRSTFLYMKVIMSFASREVLMETVGNPSQVTRTKLFN